MLHYLTPLFFRSKNGWNNNPNALQLERTYRQILFHSQLKGIGGNCEAIDSTTILALPSNKSERESTRSLFAIDFSLARKFDMDIPAVIEEHDYFIQYSPSLSENLNHVVAYICGYVIRMVQKKIRCGQCLEAIQDSLKNVSDSTKLLSRKDRGKRILKFIIYSALLYWSLFCRWFVMAR